MTATLAVLRILRGAPDGLTSLQLITKLPKVPERTVRDALTRLVKRGYIEAAGKKIDKASVWHITEPGATAAAALTDEPAQAPVRKLKPEPMHIGRVRSVFELGGVV